MPLEICPQVDTVRCPHRREECKDPKSAVCVHLTPVLATEAAITALMMLELPPEIIARLSDALTMLQGTGAE